MFFLNMSRFTACAFGIVLLLAIQLTIADDVPESESESEVEENSAGWNVRFPLPTVTLKGRNRVDILFQIDGLDMVRLLETKAVIRFVSTHPDIVFVSKVIPLEDLEDGVYVGLLGLYPVGHAAGNAEIYVEIAMGTEIEKSSQTFKVTVDKTDTSTLLSIVKFLVGSNITHILYVLLFFNFGVVINVKNVKTVFENPRGVIIAIVLNVLMIPVVSNIHFSKLIHHPISQK